MSTLNGYSHWLSKERFQFLPTQISTLISAAATFNHVQVALSLTRPNSPTPPTSHLNSDIASTSLAVWPFHACQQLFPPQHVPAY